MFMHRLIVAAIILNPLVARAWEPLQGALSLDFGGCWIRPENPGPRWKIVSFGDRVVSNYGANEFQQLLDPSITTTLRTAFESFPASETETYYRCAGGTHFFWTSIPATGGPVPLCVWSQVQRNPDTGQLALTVLDVYPDHEYRQGVACNGESRRSLLIYVRPSSDINAVMAYLLNDPRYDGVYDSLGTIGTEIITARLQVAYDYRENVIKQLLETDKVLAPDLSLVVYDGRVSFAGESYRLFAGTYPGY
jgi:hypothetical protein